MYHVFPEQTNTNVYCWVSEQLYTAFCNALWDTLSGLHSEMGDFEKQPWTAFDGCLYQKRNTIPPALCAVLHTEQLLDPASLRERKKERQRLALSRSSTPWLIGRCGLSLNQHHCREQNTGSTCCISHLEPCVKLQVTDSRYLDWITPCINGLVAGKTRLSGAHSPFVL